MGVTYKLKEEVVSFIISQRQANPLSSCRQLAEEASQKFGLKLSKSSIHDVLKESGIITPRGRKPKNKFEIPQEKKKQIQTNLSQVKLLPPLQPPEAKLIPDITEYKPPLQQLPQIQGAAQRPQAVENKEQEPTAPKDMEISAEYEGAGKIFLKAALWDLGIYSEGPIKESDWSYYLTYCKGIKVVLENNKEFFIDLPAPIERCIREAVDGLINNVKPLIVQNVSDEALFKSTMEAHAEDKIEKISIVEQNNHILFEINNIVGLRREFIIANRLFVENKFKDPIERAKSLFLPQLVDNNEVINNIVNLKGFDSINEHNNIVTLTITNGYENESHLREAADRLNSMYLQDDQNRLVKIQLSMG